ncbi:hypothetical protein C7212DRAFT_341395 [Tuber magnatum]|uniref:Uncharacterized protein n=1 Tax=Tuber magnatum TaxID=42249 RepID=A0A317SWM5_9PEZI|nr:hypothetical protein C7212DRAFT_341395 [Tuber magnatum]
MFSEQRVTSKHINYRYFSAPPYRVPHLNKSVECLTYHTRPHPSPFQDPIVIPSARETPLPPSPLFGEAYHKAMKADSKSEFAKSKEAIKSATLMGSSLVGSSVQTYAVAALLNHSAALSYKGAAYVGALVFAVTSAPAVSLSIPRIGE